MIPQDSGGRRQRGAELRAHPDNGGREYQGSRGATLGAPRPAASLACPVLALPAKFLSPRLQARRQTGPSGGAYALPGMTPRSWAAVVFPARLREMKSAAAQPHPPLSGGAFLLRPGLGARRVCSFLLPRYPPALPLLVQQDETGLEQRKMRSVWKFKKIKTPKPRTANNP